MKHFADEQFFYIAELIYLIKTLITCMLNILSCCMGVKVFMVSVAGGASILQGLCTTTKVTQDVRNRARKLLLEGMGKSSYLRERVLDAFLGLSLDHNSCSRDIEGRGREENTDVASNSDDMCNDKDDGEQRSVALGSLQDFLWRCYI